MKEWKKDIDANDNQNREGVAIFIVDKIDFKSKIGTRDKERCHIFMKVSIHSENITITNRFSKQSSEYMKEK